MTTHPLAPRVNKIVESVLARASNLYGQHFPMPVINYDVRGRLGGLAYYRSNLIRINPYVLERNTEEFLAQIVPHEVCHLLAHQIYPYKQIKPHGPEWKSVMRRLGYPPTRCHSFEVEQIRKTRKFRYVCNCMKHTVGHAVHKKMQAGQKRICLKCRQRVIFLNEILATDSAD